MKHEYENKQWWITEAYSPYAVGWDDYWYQTWVIINVNERDPGRSYLNIRYPLPANLCLIGKTP